MFNNTKKILTGVFIISSLSFSKGMINFQKQLMFENGKKIEITENDIKDSTYKNNRDKEEKIRYKIVSLMYMVQLETIALTAPALYNM